MTKPIVKHFLKMNNHYAILLVFAVFLNGCIQIKSPMTYQETECDTLNSVTFRIDSIHTLKGYFIMEHCDKIGFSQCRSCHESYKHTRGFVNFGTPNMRTNYYNAYYSYWLGYNKKLDSLFPEKMKLREINQVFDKIDSVQKAIDTSIYLPFFHRQMKRNYRKYKDDCYRFDGHFGFKKVNLELKVVYVGVRCIIMPNYSQKSRHESIFIEQKCHVYHILDIKYLGP